MIRHDVHYHSTRLEWTRLVMVVVVALMIGAIGQRIHDAQMMSQCVNALDHARNVVEDVQQRLGNRRCK